MAFKLYSCDVCGIMSRFYFADCPACKSKVKANEFTFTGEMMLTVTSTGEGKKK